MGATDGDPVRGSRAARKVADPTLHTDETENDSFTLHLDPTAAEGEAMVMGGAGAYVATNIVTQAELPHAVLSATHTDTTAASLVRGDLLVVIGATPKLTRYAWASPSAAVMRYFGGANGEVEPTYKDASSNPGAAAAILQTDADGYASAARLGAGVYPPTLPLDVLGNALFGNIDSVATKLALKCSAIGNFVLGYRSAGTIASPSAVAADRTLLGMAAFGYGATGWLAAETGSILIQSSAQFTDASAPTRIVFLTTPSDSVTQVERMRIDATGNLLLSPGVIAPLADGTTALRITKADTTTVLLNVDSTNRIISIPDPAGRLLVGTSTNDGAPFQMHQTGTSAPLSIYAHADTSYLLPYVQMRRSRGTEASPSNVSSGDALGALYGVGYGAGAYRAGAAIQMEVDAALSSSMPGRIVFYTGPAASSYVALEAMRITSAQFVGIGKATPLRRLEIGDPTGSVDVPPTGLRLSSTGYVLTKQVTTIDVDGAEFHFSKDFGGYAWKSYLDIRVRSNATSWGVGSTIRFWTNDATGGSADLEQMRLNSVGLAIGLTSNPAKLAVDQSSTTGALPVLSLDQGDVSEEFIRLIGTSAADNSQSLIDAADLTTPGAIVAWIKVYIQDDAGSGAITDGYYYVPAYAAPTA